MPAPTALKTPAADEAPPVMDVDAAPPPADGGAQEEEEEEFMLGTAEHDILVAAETIAVPAEQGAEMAIDEESRPRFAPARDAEPLARRETRKVPVPPHRMTPLKANWPQIYEPLVKHLKLQV